ncbi:porin [Nitrincola nitratireducens]|uniref:Outer membrane protein (Porin) n=1 Tax=Nitrincola nitratireducens TaxID=1229521 RepID=W9US36_9GAMM|nr:porin [Nitrincola nitratireducens]EXJ09884.1 Outer membrane protein (porin) [Nitrincola nitratireducens]
MKKSIMSLAVAAVVAAPAIAQADATLFGTFEAVMKKEATRSAELTDGGSSIGIMGTVDLGLDDTKGIFYWEQDLDVNAGALVSGSGEAHLGATGSWGTAIGGKFDHATVTMVSDYTDITYQGSLESVDNYGLAPNSIAYISPDMNGVTFMAGGVFAGDLGPQKDRQVDAYNLGVAYDANGLYAAAAYGNMKNTKAANTYAVNENLWGLAAGFSGIENLDLRANYTRQNDKTAVEKTNAWNLSAQYDIENTALYGVYGRSKEKNSNARFESYTVGAAQTMGNGAVYAEFVGFTKDYKFDPDTKNTFLVGYQLNF